MRFIVDAQLPPALAELLREFGEDGQAVREVGLRDAEDGAIWNYALTHAAVIVTKDEDFAWRSAHLPTAPPVVWLRIGNCSNLVLLRWFKAWWPTIRSRLQNGEALIEVID